MGRDCTFSVVRARDRRHGACGRAAVPDACALRPEIARLAGCGARLKQRVLLTLPGQAEIIPAPEMIYGLDPDLREPPPLGALSPVGRRPEDHPGGDNHDEAASGGKRATEELATPD